MHCTGVDLIETSRISRVVERWGDRFLNRIYTETELLICREKPERLASRFAGKEAVMKALGTGVRGVGWREIEIGSEPGGRPVVNLYGKAREKAEHLGLEELAISLSDTKDHSIAFVVGEVGQSKN
jgi:holo-[acyl-carrier protein] synthase